MKVSVSFQQGKQNQDVDEMFIANGEYRELVNGRVLDSDTENSGCITSLKGTEELFNEPLVANWGYKAIATTSHEDLLYVFFAHNYFGNAIVEYDTIKKTSCIVFVDANISNTALDVYQYLKGNTAFSGAFVKFTKIGEDSDVTMHVYEGMLFFHDREDEPFKINIERAKELSYYTSREQITVAKMPPFAPQISVTKSGNLEVQNFNAGDYKFASRFIYDDGEVSAVSPLSTMPIKVLGDDHLSASTISSVSGDIEVENHPEMGEHLNITKKDIGSGYSIQFVHTNVDYNTSSFKVAIFDRTGTSVHGEKTMSYTWYIPFKNMLDNSQSQTDFALSSSNQYQRYPVVLSASTSRKDTTLNGKGTSNDDVIAFITNTRQGAGGFIPVDQSRLFIYYVKEKTGYYLPCWGNDAIESANGWDFQSVHVTCDGDVYVSYRKSKEYGLAKFNKELNKLVQVTGATCDVGDKHRVAKPHTIASNYTGNIVYYVHTRNNVVSLFQSTESGKKATFKQIANREMMFADTLDYIQSYGGDNQNRWNVSCCCSSDGLIVYVGNSNCVARSDDGGQSWQSYVIDEDNVDNGAVIDMKCSADGKILYAVVGVGDNAVNNTISASGLEVEDNNYPHYSGNLYASMSYGKSFRMVELNANTFYSNAEPTNARVRSIVCNDSGDTIIAEGFIWSYFKDTAGTSYTTTDYPNSGDVIFPSTSQFMSSDFGFHMYATSWGQGQSYAGVDDININGYDPVTSYVGHGFNATMDLSKIFRNQNVTYSSILMAHTLQLNDIKKTKIENDVAEVSLLVPVLLPNVKEVELLMNHNGTYYSISKIPFDNSTQYVSTTFTNEGLLSAIATKDATKLYDNVPLKANTSSITQNALMFGGYTDGYDTFDVTGFNVSVSTSAFTTGDVSLKSNTTYGYAIIAYDKYNRCTSPIKIGSITTPALSNKKISAYITHSDAFRFPDWVSHFKFCRTKLRNNYYVINGFDDALMFGNKILLDITSNVNIVPEIGDTLELVYDYHNPDTSRFIVPIIGYIDNKSGVYRGEIEESEKLAANNNRYIVINNNMYDGYNNVAVTMGDSHFTSSLFYINSSLSTDELDNVYYEIPYTLTVDNGKPSAELYNAQIWNRTNSYALKDDGDVIMFDAPSRELNILNNSKRFTTLGRVALYSENNKQQYRKASICTSEPYVQDTGFNGMSSFNTSLVNYKDLDPKYGDIEAIDGIDDKIAVFQKYRCSQLQYKKNILSTATGDALVSKAQDIFGEQIFYALEYGLTDHHSLVKWGNSRFFADQKRGAVLRIDYNGIHNISNNGMRNYFYKNLSNNTGKILACYDVAHSSYMLFHPVDDNVVCDNYYTPNDGWSARYEINPDIIINTMNGVFSFKGSKLYKHDAIDAPVIYGESKDITMRIPCNSNPNIIKDFNAIQVDSTTAPVFSRFKTRTGESTMGVDSFEKTETAYQSYIPMVSGTIVANPVFCGISMNNYSNTTARFTINDNTNIHQRDSIITCTADSNGVYKQVGNVHRIISVTPIEIVVLVNGTISRGMALFAVDSSQVNGHAHKDTSMMLELKFSSATVVKSITMDINESKI